MTASADRTSPGAGADRRAWTAPGFMGLWVCGLCWNWARWGLAFLAALHVNEATDSPRLVQLTGTTLWAPLLVGGVIGGVVADRFDRLRTIRVQMVVMVAMLLVAGTLLRTDRLEVWMMYPFLLLAGIGWVGDMTSRRSLVYETVGERRVDHAMAVEMASTASGVAIGNLLGGAAADALGVGNALLCLGGFLSVGLVALATVRRSHFVASSPAGRPPIGRELREGLALARDSRPLQSILGVTVLANFCFFAYFPAVQRIGDRLGAGEFGIGLLASMTGFGMLAGSWFIIRFDPVWRGRLYAGGVVVGMALLVPFALSPTLWFACVALFLANCGSGFFGANQSTLVLTAVDDEVRGRAMGLLSMAIGALPVGTFVLGEIAEQTGARTAILVMGGIGFVAMAWWLRTHGEVLDMVRED